MQLSKKIISFIIISLFLVFCSKKKEEGVSPATTASILLLSSSGSARSTTPPPSTTPITNTTPSPTSLTSSLTLSKTSLVSGEQINATINITGVSSGAKDHTLTIYLSTNSTITSSDLAVGTLTVNNSTTNTQTLSITIPSTLVPETDIKPKQYYYGTLAGTETSETTFSTMNVYPFKSKLGSVGFTDTSITESSFDADTTQYFFTIFNVSNISKITFSAFAVSAGLDVALSVYQYSSASNAFVLVGTERNENGAANFEFGSYNLSGSGFTKGVLRIRKVSGTTGTFKVAGMANSVTSIPFIVFSGSCNTASGFCAQFIDNAPTNTTECQARIAGSTYAGNSCSSTNALSKQCYGNPFDNIGRVIITFYNTDYNDTTASTTCGGDIFY